MYSDLSGMKARLAVHVSNTWTPSTKRPPEETANALLSWKRSQELFNDMKSFLGPFKGKRLLEVGCGYGLFVVICNKNGIRAEGVEPANQEFYKFTLELSNEILKRSGLPKKLIKKSTGEKLPYKDNTFDAVVSLYTLEHVQDVGKVLAESTRVLKPGGYLYCVVPNYGSFWEGHYGIVWIPYLSKSLSKLYVCLWGKGPGLLNELQLVNQLVLERHLKSLPLKVENWGNDSFVSKVQRLSISGGTMGSAKKLLVFLNYLKMLKFTAILASFFKAQTPIILVARKVVK
ncbi:MAG: class I SAM-dependent methyltransferase [Candidatus Curtissbacteria bacterium]